MRAGQRRRYVRIVRYVRRTIAVMGVLVMLFAIVFAIRETHVRTSGKAQAVVAAAEREVMANETLTSEKGIVSTGISGVVNGICETETPVYPIRKIGSSYEAVIVGQRASCAMSVNSMPVYESMQKSVADLNYVSQSRAVESTIMSDADYETLLSIVEAEVGGEDVKSRILVANVIMNRVKDHRFPDSVTEVVWERSNGAAQFSPTEDGRINTVEISEMTKEAVRQVLEGVDYSEGALFFVAKDQALESNVVWFESDLKPLFTHGDHAFYTFP